MNAFLNNIVSSHQYILVDFHAMWCEPCKWVEPILVDVEKHFAGKIVLQKIDIDEHPDTARELHVLSVPTLVLFKDGKEVWRIRGFDTLPNMVNALSKFVTSNAA
jgi:thioredoxin 1